MPSKNKKKKSYLRLLLSPSLRHLLLLAVVTIFSVVHMALAATPNPGHPYSEVSGGVVQGDLIYGSAADTLSILAKDANATRYLSNTGTSNSPAWAQVDLSNGVTGALPIGSGGSTETASTEDAVLVGASTTDWVPKVLPDCDTASTSKLLYDQTTNAFSCGADGGALTTLTSTSTVSDAVVATYTAIPGISFTPAASTNYLIDCFIIYTSTAATTGINFAWDVPAAVTSIHMSGFTTTVATGANEGFIQRADNVGTSTSASIITTEQVAVLRARLRNGANATATTLGFTPETANSVSVLINSTCEYHTY